MANVWCPKWVLHISTPLSNGPAWLFQVAMDTGTALMMGPRHGVAELLRHLGGCQWPCPVTAGRLQIPQRFPIFFFNEGEHGDQP